MILGYKDFSYEERLNWCGLTILEKKHSSGRGSFNYCQARQLRVTGINYIKNRKEHYARQKSSVQELWTGLNDIIGHNHSLYKEAIILG